MIRGQASMTLEVVIKNSSSYPPNPFVPSIIEQATHTFNVATGLLGD